MTANEFTNVKNVKDCFLYTKDEYVFMYLRVYRFNISLLPDKEKKAKTSTLTASSENDRKDFVFFSLPREIDLDGYTRELKERHQREIVNVGRRHLLAEMLRESKKLSTSGENYEHWHYIKLWRYIGKDQARAENELRSRTQEFKRRYSNVGIQTEILKDADILTLCNLFGNATQATYEQFSENMLFDSILLL